MTWTGVFTVAVAVVAVFASPFAAAAAGMCQEDMHRRDMQSAKRNMRRMKVFFVLSWLSTFALVLT